MSRTPLVLSSRITLTNGQSLIDKDVFVPETFAYDTELAAILVTGDCCTIRNVRLTSYATDFLTAWQTSDAITYPGTGIPRSMAGIRVNACKGAHIESVHVEGFPAAGIQGYDIEDLHIERYSSNHCFSGIILNYVNFASKRITMRGITVSNTWGPGPGYWPGIGGAPSVERPGGFIASDGLSGAMNDFSISYVNAFEEMLFGLKLNRSKRGSVSRVKTNAVFLQGREGRYENNDHTTDGSENVIFSHMDLDKSYGVGEATDNGNCLQLSDGITDCSFSDLSMKASGFGGHGVECSGDVHVDIRGCTVDGFNQERFGGPAYALHLNDDGDVNADFLTANTFLNQQRLVLED